MWLIPVGFIAIVALAWCEAYRWKWKGASHGHGHS